MNQQLNLFDDTPEVSQVKPGLPTARRRSLQLGTVVLNYELKRARRRTIGLSISDGGLVIAAPRWVGRTALMSRSPTSGAAPSPGSSARPVARWRAGRAAGAHRRARGHWC